MKPVSIASKSGDQRTLPPETVQRLRQGLAGEILLPEDPGYDAARRIWNGMIDKHPAMIVQCASTADVVHAVNLARDRGLRLSIRGGGHNVAGGSIADKGRRAPHAPGAQRRRGGGDQGRDDRAKFC